MAASAPRAEMPVFSYAQAAKGLASAASTQPAKSADQPQAAEQSSHAPTSRVTSAESCREPDKVDPVADSETKSVTASSSRNAVSGDSSSATAATSNGAKEEASQTPNGTSDATGEKPSQESTSAENAAGDAQDASKTEAKAEKKPEPPSDSAGKPALGELKAAPIPAVNVWQERMEKAKANAARNAAKTLTAKQPGAQTAGDDADKAGNNQRESSAQGKDRRRVEPGKARDEGSRKSSGRFSRPNDEPAEAPLPPVGDDSAWPTPQTAVGEEKRKAQERSEKQERAEKPSGARGKEKWTPVPYVPTAVFNTPLPSSARRGSRAPRGGRDGGRGGAHGGNDSKSVSETTGHSKQGPGVERGRNDSSGAARSNSLPAQARRPTSVDANGQGDHRRSQQSHGGNRFRGEGRSKASESATTNGGPSSAGGEGTSKPFRDQRSGKFPEFTPSSKTVDNAPKSAPLPGDGHGNQRFNGGPRSTEFTRDANGVRDHKEFKGDRDHPRERGDSRPERGRGGYRGRGGHYGNGAHYGNAQYQHAFGPKGFGQRGSQHGFQNGGQSNHRLPFRSPPMANAPGVYNPYGVPDFGAFYPGFQPVPPGPMAAVPYQPYMEPYTLMGLIQMQLDYYFSVDNLCKDMFLRRHMDSQGFVPLTFIANFKRIKNLTEDLDLIRHCCHHARNVEHQLGADGVDRVRPREKWQQWVLPMDQRDPSARHDGPPAAESQTSPEGEKPEENVPAASSAQPSLTNGSTSNGAHVQSNGLPNGAAAAPEFTPAAAQSEVVNHSG